MKKYLKAGREFDGQTLISLENYDLLTMAVFSCDHDFQ